VHAKSKIYSFNRSRDMEGPPRSFGRRYVGRPLDVCKVHEPAPKSKEKCKSIMSLTLCRNLESKCNCSTWQISRL